MKKSLVKKLVCMAKDGDPEAIEAIAELLEEAGETEAVETAVPAEAAEVVAEAVENPAVVVETPEKNTVAIDDDTVSGILERLDRIIELLTPEPAGDEDPAEEIAEVIEEAVEAAEAEGNEDVPGISAEEISEIVGEILDPDASGDPEPGEDECGEKEPGVISTGDALRAALRAVSPALAKMPRKQRTRVCADISARLREQSGRRASDGKTYAALATASRREPAAVGPDLGKRIMASRNPNYRGRGN